MYMSKLQGWVFPQSLGEGVNFFSSVSGKILQKPLKIGKFPKKSPVLRDFHVLQEVLRARRVDRNFFKARIGNPTSSDVEKKIRKAFIFNFTAVLSF